MNLQFQIKYQINCVFPTNIIFFFFVISGKSLLQAYAQIQKMIIENFPHHMQNKNKQINFPMKISNENKI